jgi:fructoselysine-6-P-deglycase FrlB-like protein
MAATRAPSPGHLILLDEMARQHADARCSLRAQPALASAIAERIHAAGRCLMLGMGASHWANRMALGSYRAAGIDAFAEVLSDHMRLPLPPREQVVLLTSQSGESGEVRAYLDRFAPHADHFGLTMEADSHLARSLPSLIGQGGRERAFAATRSVLVTLALHASILAALDQDTSKFEDVLKAGGREPAPTAIADAVDALAKAGTVFMASRGVANAVLEAASLTYMELARVPSIALELGQLVHGPMECLSPSSALVLVRPASDDAKVVARVARQAVDVGLRPVVIDMGQHEPIDGCVGVELPVQDGLALAAQLLPVIQRIAVEAAALKVAEMGTPLRSSKVMDGELL